MLMTKIVESTAAKSLIPAVTQQSKPMSLAGGAVGSAIVPSGASTANMRHGNCAMA